MSVFVNKHEECIYIKDTNEPDNYEDVQPLFMFVLAFGAVVYFVTALTNCLSFFQGTKYQISIVNTII